MIHWHARPLSAMPGSNRAAYPVGWRCCHCQPDPYNSLLVESSLQFILERSVTLANLKGSSLCTVSFRMTLTLACVRALSWRRLPADALRIRVCCCVLPVCAPQRPVALKLVGKLVSWQKGACQSLLFNHIFGDTQDSSAGQRAAGDGVRACRLRRLECAAAFA